MSITVVETPIQLSVNDESVTLTLVGIQGPSGAGGGGGGSGTVTSVSVTTHAGVSGTVTNPTTTPAISLTLGAITPTSVAATGTVTGSNLSGTNTGDQDLSPYLTIASAASTYVPLTRTVNGHALSANVTVTASDVGLGNVTNDAQTKAAIVPNTAPTSGQVLVGNAGGTAYAPVTISGSGATVTLSNLGVLTIGGIANASLTNSSVTISGHTLSLGGTLSLVASDVGLGSVTNDAQTKAAIVPNTAPTSGQVLVGNAGGTAYAPVTLSGSGATVSLSSLGVLTISSIANASLANSSVSVTAGTGLSGGGSVALGSSVTLTVSYGTTAGTACQGNDSRLSDSRTPTGSAGGDLTGTYPNPTIAANAVTSTKIAANAVTAAKMATNTANTLAGYDGSGNFADVAVGSGLSLSAGTLTATGGGGSGDMLATGINAIATLTNADGTAAYATHTIVKATTGAHTITLPAPALSGGKPQFVSIVVDPTSTKLVTISQHDTTTHTDTIDGANTRVLWAGERALLMTDGTNWFKIGGVSLPLRANMELHSATTFNTGGPQLVQFDTAVNDPAGLATTGASAKITIPRPGFWNFAEKVVVSGVVDGDNCVAALFKNGSEYQSGNEVAGSANSIRCTFVALNQAVAASDYFQMYVAAINAAGSAASLTTYNDSRYYTVLEGVEIPSW